MRQKESSCGREVSPKMERSVKGWERSWRSAGRGQRLGVTGMPARDTAHGFVTAGTQGRRGGGGLFQLMNRGQVLQGLPSGVLGLSQERRLIQQGADAVEVFATGRMKPTEEADAMETLREDVLEEAAEQFEGFQIQVSGLAGAAVAIGPTQASGGQEADATVGGGGLKDVTAEIAQGGLSGADGLNVHDPALFPDAGRQLGQCLRTLLSQGLAEESSEMVGQGNLGQEEGLAFGIPLTLIGAQAAARDEIMDVGMIDESAAPGVEEAKHPQGGTQAFRVAGQVLQSAGTGGKEKGVANFGMGTEPGTQWIGQGEGDQEVRDGQEQLGMLLEPSLGVGLTALRTVAIVAGMEGVVVSAAIGAEIERAPLLGGATGEDLAQDLTLADGHGGAVTFQVGRTPTGQDLVERQRERHARRNGRRHGRGGLEIGHELIEALLMGGLGDAGQMGINGGSGWIGMAEVDLDLAQVFPLLQQMSGVGMAQAMDMAGLLDAALFESHAESTLDGAAVQGVEGGGSALSVATLGWEEQTGMTMGLPGLAQQFQSALGQGDVTVSVAFAASDVSEHAFGVDVADLQVDAFAQAQAAGIDGHQTHLVVQGGDAGQHPAHLFSREDDRQLELIVGSHQFQFLGPGAVEGFFPEQFDGADGLGGGLAGKFLFLFEVDAVLANLLRGHLLGIFAVELAELADAGVVSLFGAGADGQEFEIIGEGF